VKIDISELDKRRLAMATKIVSTNVKIQDINIPFMALLGLIFKVWFAWALVTLMIFIPIFLVWLLFSGVPL